MENTDFTTMQEQIKLLKHKLEKEDIINERLLRETINNKVDYLKRMEWFGYIAILFVITVGSFVFYKNGNSIWFIGGTILFMLIIGVFNFIMHNSIHESDIMTENLLTTAKKVRKMKQDYMTWFKIGFPSVIVWFIWFAFDLYFINNDLKPMIINLASGCFGGLIGGAIGYRKYKKLLHSCDEIVMQIEK